MTRTGSPPWRIRRLRPAHPFCGTRAGQAIIFFALALVILVFVVIWTYDLHRILYTKSITQNAGDASALMAARWQGITLNMIGDLNIMHAIALTSDDANTAATITNIQARLCFVGPMIALMACQEAAKNNGMYRNPDFDAFMHEHAQHVRNGYGSMTDDDGSPLFPEPYEGCWADYADMLDLVADEGMAAGPDNLRLYTDYVGGHYLLMIEFYEAIAGKTWCWFCNNAPTLLEDYENFQPCWWPPLPEIPHMEYVNSEVFSLRLSKCETTLSSLLDLPTINSNAAERGFTTIVDSNAMAATAAWYCYNTEAWGPWNAMATTGPDPFPLTGPVKDTYDYAGADVAVRIEASTTRLTPAQEGASITNVITWSAGAKPFGYLGDADKPTRYGLVLPAFRETHLVPIDAVSGPSGGGYNLEWRRHIEQHLPGYMRNGPQPSSCWYCQQLLTWENSAFRQDGIDWLAVNSWQCTMTTPGPGSYDGGGRRRGH
ncbi:MAG: Tad domain-containing protein [Verrucomicrobiota bacterium]|nr:Tad domain-containing protein [Verrucomicrobiota bacterium]